MKTLDETSHAPQKKGEALMFLLSLESPLKQRRPADAAACFIEKHVDLLIATQSEARLSRATQSHHL
ncbi:DUF6477 family protein [Shimia sp. MIT910701]|uniref:DUF6477 family protein n=1 Tax=Shimia sp. MIT910701 TaxID=3096987 RepID=UPI00399AF865